MEESMNAEILISYGLASMLILCAMLLAIGVVYFLLELIDYRRGKHK
jgi:hypothetical protein